MSNAAAFEVERLRSLMLDQALREASFLIALDTLEKFDLKIDSLQELTKFVESSLKQQLSNNF